MAPAMEVLTADPPEDPDAQHTVTDFLDYTEYLPSDLVRSLTLIGKLDESYLGAAGEVHDLTKEYGSLPDIPLNQRRNTEDLRHQISHRLDHAISCRESAYGEATRLFEMVDRHYNRLTSIITKLHALPKPPSRDPTPVPRSPQATRKSPPPRITLRLDGARAAASAGRSSAKPEKRYRSRKVTVPGEVLPPPNPDSPLPLTDSDWESAPPSPIPMPTSRVGGSRKPARIRAPRPPKLPKIKIPKPPRPPRVPGQIGTNVHSSVAGISTSNALSLLTPPPPDPKPGSKHAPWMRLTEWEMAKLRKRMKKNAIWTPSETMIRRELNIADRGPENYRKAMKLANERGEEFLDEDDIAHAEPGRPLLPGEISVDKLGLGESALENRGMKLNEAKKQKREILARERAAELESEAQKLGSLGSTFKELFSKPPSTPAIPAIPAIPSPLFTTTFSMPKDPFKVKSAQRERTKDHSKSSAKKRKRDEETPKSDISSKPAEPKPAEPKPIDTTTSPVKTSSKKRKTEQPRPAPIAVTTETVTTTVPLAAPAPSPPKSTTRRSRPATPATPVMPAPEKPKAVTTPKSIATSTATSSRPRRVSLTLKGPAEPPPQEPVQPSSPRPATRTASRPASVEKSQPPPTTRDHPRRKSATPAPLPSPVPVVTAAGRRSKRPAPGPVIESQEEGPAVSVGKRTHAPKKRGERKVGDGAKDKENAMKLEEVAAEEIDPDEPRYCICGDVSFGDMIACENENVSFTTAPRNVSTAGMLTYLGITVVRERMVPFRLCGIEGVAP